MRRFGPIAILGLIAVLAARAEAHDIPNARVDRSIQLIVGPGRLRIDYGVGLSELTLTQDLRALIGTLPGTDRKAWLDRYGEVSGPLNAKGLLLAVDGVPLELQRKGFDLVVEDHPRYTFHYEATLPEAGRLTFQDTNYEAGEGSSLLAIRGDAGARVVGEGYPSSVASITPKPLWQMTDEEERRTKRLEVEYASAGGSAEVAVTPATPRPSRQPSAVAEGLSRLLDRSGTSAFGLWLLAFGLGAAHAVQPGHGKSLVAAASVGEGGGWSRGAILALVITLAHIGGVLAVALALWGTHSSRYPDIHRSLTQGAGFVIAAIGLWRLGRYAGGYGEHAEADEGVATAGLGTRGIVGLGLAGGIVPCWDAVILVLLAEAVGRLALGLVLLTAFSLGMATILVVVGVLAARLRGYLQAGEGEQTWSRRLGLLSGLAVTLIGLWLMSF